MTYCRRPRDRSAPSNLDIAALALTAAQPALDQTSKRQRTITLMTHERRKRATFEQLRVTSAGLRKCCMRGLQQLGTPGETPFDR